jgi:transcription initiation factor IIE alpha subunit
MTTAAVNKIQLVEELISAVARAFYDDDVICIVDVLIRERFLRDDTMSNFLHLPTKRLRKTLQFLKDEHIVQYEDIQIISTTANPQKQQKRRKAINRFWYIDYHHAVYSIRLRLHGMKNDLEQQLQEARNTCHYVCPGWKMKRCNGHYTEQELQYQSIDSETGLFLCVECHSMYEDNPEGPSKKECALESVDKTSLVKSIEGKLRRLDVQMSPKWIDTTQRLRPGVYDLIQRAKGLCRDGNPIPSNLPSDNIDLMGWDENKGDGSTYLRSFTEKNQLCMQYPGECQRAHHLATNFKSCRGQLIEDAVIRIGGSKHRLEDLHPTGTTRHEEPKRRKKTVSSHRTERTNNNNVKCVKATGIDFIDNNVDWLPFWRLGVSTNGTDGSETGDENAVMEEEEEVETSREFYFSNDDVFPENYEFDSIFHETYSRELERQLLLLVDDTPKVNIGKDQGDSRESSVSWIDG